MANETREQALADLEVELERLPARDLATLTGEASFFRALAAEHGATPEEFGRRLWSSEFTEARAAALVSAAARTVAERFAKAEAAKDKQRAGRKKRR